MASLSAQKQAAQLRGSGPARFVRARPVSRRPVVSARAEISYVMVRLFVLVSARLASRQHTHGGPTVHTREPARPTCQCATHIIIIIYPCLHCRLSLMACSEALWVSYPGAR